MLRSMERVLSAAPSLLLLVAMVTVPAAGITMQGSALPATCTTSFSGGPDCGTVTDFCTFKDGPLPQPANNYFACYRTCYDSGDCLIQEESCDRVTRYTDNQMYTSFKIMSPNYGSPPTTGPYRDSTICRYHIRCDGNKLLSYSFDGQEVQGQTSCGDNLGSRCVDRIRLSFPDLGECERCGNIGDTALGNCMEGATLGNEVFVEFVSNRQFEAPGFEILLNCQLPSIDQNTGTLQGFNLDRVTSQEECTSPDGGGSRNLDPVPPPDESLQVVLVGDPNAVYRILEVSDALTYNNSIIRLNTSANGLEVFESINSLSVESPFDFRQYFRIAPRRFVGYAQFVISSNEAFMVQFGVNPNLQPSEEEALAVQLLNSAISAAVADIGQFDVLNELDQLEQALPIATPPTERSKRGVDGAFLDTLALEYGNACNFVLRTVACVYQEVVMGRDCFTGQPI